jgi:hypothetical protein
MAYFNCPPKLALYMPKNKPNLIPEKEKSDDQESRPSCILLTNAVGVKKRGHQSREEWQPRCKLNVCYKSAAVQFASPLLFDQFFDAIQAAKTVVILYKTSLSHPRLLCGGLDFLSNLLILNKSGFRNKCGND